MEDSEILNHKKLALLEILEKHINTRNWKQNISVFIGNLVQALHIADTNNSNDLLINVAFKYIMSGLEKDEMQEFFEHVKIMSNHYGEKIMSYAEELRNEGMQTGMQAGVQQVACEMLQKNMPINLIKELTHLSQNEIEELHNKLHKNNTDDVH